MFKNKLIFSAILFINIIFVILLISKILIKLNYVLYGICSISIILISVNNFKKGDKIIGGMFFLAFILLSVHFFI